MLDGFEDGGAVRFDEGAIGAEGDDPRREKGFADDVEFRSAAGGKLA
jgi:hypothetical protein